MGAEGKRFRPTMLLLMASSLSSVMPSADYLTVDDRPPNVHPEEVSPSRQYCISRLNPGLYAQPVPLMSQFTDFLALMHTEFIWVATGTPQEA